VTKKNAAAEAAPTVVVAYKGFDKDLVCHPSGGKRVQYAVGETVETQEEVVRCGAGGFRACEYPLDVLGYYSPNTSRYAVVEASGKIARGSDADDSKIAASRLTLKAEIGLHGLIKAAIEYTVARAKPEGDGSHATGDYGAASSTGDYGAASSTGDYGAASSTGDYGAASSTGNRGAASSTGYRGAASSTGYRGAASSTGNRGAASSTGDYGAASSTGDYGAASSTGDYGAASSTGNRGAASSTGDCGAASSTGRNGRVMGKDGNALFLVERDDEWQIMAVWSGIVGRDGIKPDTWYTLRNGSPVEVTP
jgi:hypothetical protein